MLEEADLLAEFSTWSSHILKTVAEEEDCSELVRNTAIMALASRPFESFITITPKMIHEAGTTGYSGWNRKQLQCLGVHWPPPKGWLKGLKGAQVSAEKWNRFLALRKKPSPLTD